MMNRKGFDLDLIRRILGHEDDEMTLEYIEPWQQLIHSAYDDICRDIEVPEYENNI